MTDSKKIPVGAPVIIDTKKSKYNFNSKSNREIALMPEGILTGYSDELSGEYLIVKLRSNIEIKVSEDELSDCTKNFYFSDISLTSRLKKNIANYLKIDFTMVGNRQIKYILNPLNFLKWIRYTIKDII